MNKTILVTGIGGVVGQGILKNIRIAYPSFRLIGTNTQLVSTGNYLCDNVYEVPMGDHPDYKQKMLAILREEGIDLIISSTDLESYHLGLFKEELDAVLAISSPSVTAMCLDKLHTFQEFKQRGIPFAESILPSNYRGEFDEIIVKPRTGRGSRGIHINPDNVKSFDDTFLVQKLYRGEEITTACYVRQNGKIHGMITFKRSLDNGNTTFAEVTKAYDLKLNKLAEGIVQSFPFRGSFNIQSIVTPEKLIVPFEINGRISGTNSIRSHFGFKDVKYTIQEWLLGEQPEEVNISYGSAMRVISDVIYPDQSLNEIANRTNNHFIK